MIPNLPQYQCHKIVGAFKITDVKMVDVDHIELSGVSSPVSVERTWVLEKIKKTESMFNLIGKYFVQYEDGYLSWSPKHVFERCYRELTPQEIGMTFDY